MVPAGSTGELRLLNAASIIIVLQGENIHLTVKSKPEMHDSFPVRNEVRGGFGSTIFIAANSVVDIANRGESDLLLFRAHVNLE